jgi:hypothetical protein
MLITNPSVDHKPKWEHFEGMLITNQSVDHKPKCAPQTKCGPQTQVWTTNPIVNFLKVWGQNEDPLEMGLEPLDRNMTWSFADEV